MPIDKAWGMCCDGYFNLLKQKKDNELLAETKTYFKNIFEKHNLSLLGAMIAFSEIYYFQNIRKLNEEFKKNTAIVVQQADNFLLIKVHANQFRKDCEYTEILDKEFAQMYKLTEIMIAEMGYIKNEANIPNLK